MVPGGTYCSHCGRSCSCTSTTFVATTIALSDALTAFADSFAGFEKLMRGPIWGWWTEFYPQLRPALPRARPPMASRPHRAQARACAKNARRWKRRRFIQSLRARA